MSRSWIHVTSCIFDGTILHGSVLIALQGLPLPARAWHANRFPQGLVYLACQYPSATSKRNSRNGNGNSSNRHSRQQPRNQASRPRPSHAKSKALACKALTPPMTVQVEAQLGNLEQAANPWWSTFCGISNGV